MPQIVIQGTIIDFPDSAAAPNWAPAVIQFAMAVATALTASVGTYDISPQNYEIDSYNNVSNQNIPALQFSTSQVRAAHIRYSVFRTTNTNTVYEAGSMVVVYNPGNSSGSKWELIREFEGNGKIAFNITDTGQMQFTTTSLSGSNHAGKIIFAAQSLLQS